MLRRKFKPNPSTTQNHKQRQRLLGKYSYRLLLLTAILTSGSWLPILPVLAASPTPGTVIDNQATGSFTDTGDNTEKQIESNVVQVTVAEVAGITVTASSVPTEAPSSVTGAGLYQGNGAINTGDVVYFDFTLTNVGNDPTQFFLPGAPSSITGGTLQGSMQIIEVDPDGSGATAPTALTVNIPSGGDRTGSDGAGNNGLLAANGSIPAGGTVKIRVPIKVTAPNTGDTVKVVLGDAPVPPNDQNQPYIAGNKDVYTLDNPDGTAGEAAGTPINGDATIHRQEGSATSSTTLVAPPGVNISGTVFDDVNYGGGAGRNYATANISATNSGISTGAIRRPNTRVELYDAAGNFKTFTLTDANGAYTFTDVPASANYTVRVVNNTVTPPRPSAGGTIIPVQTYRTTAVGGTAVPVTDRVGGENPTLEDAGNGSTTLAALTTTTTTAQSITQVTAGTSNITGIDFGFNFDTIVSIRDAGQGSLRQFIINSNALLNTNLAQEGVLSGREESIFMISDGAAHPGLRAGLPNSFSGGVATITLATALPAITGANGNRTSIDGRTQTALTGDTNPPVFDVTTGPEIVIDVAAGPGITVNTGSTFIKNIGITGANGTNTVGAGVYFNGSVVNWSRLENTTIFGNDNAGITLQNGATNVTVMSNIIRNNGLAQPLASGVELVGASGNLINENAILNNPGYGIDMRTTANNNNNINGNQIHDNGAPDDSQDAGIGLRLGSNNIIGQNTIYNNLGDGIVVVSGNGNTIAENSIFNNGGLGIDLGGGTEGDGVTLNDTGDVDTGANDLLNFPVLETAKISAGNLVVTGFARPGATIEFFVKAPDPSGFGEGQEYLVTYTEGSASDTDMTVGTYTNPVNGLNQGTDITNRFKFTIPLNELPIAIASTDKLTATATCFTTNGCTSASNGSTSEFSGIVTISGRPHISLVKRITAINGVPFSGFDGTTADPNNNGDTSEDANWPTPLGNYLPGRRDGGLVKPGDEVEYTIYFLNSENPATNVTVCDLIPDNMTLVPTGYNAASPHPTESGAISTDTGIGFALNANTLPTLPTAYLTNVNDSDRGRYYPPYDPNTPSTCKVLDAQGKQTASGSTANTNGAVVVEMVKNADAVNQLPPATSSGTPTNSYGFIRFKAKVK